MNQDQLLLIACGVFVIAFLYSSVGQAGASGYIAVMSLFALAPAFIKPTALVLNTFVASIATWQFYRAGHFTWRLFWPFALLSVPFAVLGGAITLPDRAFKLLVGSFLLLSAAGFAFRSAQEHDYRQPSRWLALILGAALGFLAGVTGLGGGVLLTPLIFLMRWSGPRNAAAISAAFILVNSVAALAGYILTTSKMPPFSLVLAVSAVVGGILGSFLGSYHLSERAIKLLLAIVLAVAGVKLLLS